MTTREEDILDDMSLSDDDMLDDLANDMLEELEQERQQQEEDDQDQEMPSIPTVQFARPASNANAFNNANSALSFGNNASAAGGSGGMPDLGQMMNQMMPMMSQMFGGNNPMFGNQLEQQPAKKVTWEEAVAKYVPASEQQEWLTTHQRDHAQMIDMVRSGFVNKVHSRSYRMKSSTADSTGGKGKSHALPNVYLNSATLFASILHEAVRAAQCDSDAWREYHENLVSNITKSGLLRVFEQELKTKLRQKIIDDPDFQQAKERFPNINKTLCT